MEASEMINKSVTKLLGDHETKLTYLKDRWNDEKEYEDWADYEKRIREILVDYKIVRVLKVGFVYELGEYEVTVKINSRSITSSAKVMTKNKKVDQNVKRVAREKIQNAMNQNGQYTHNIISLVLSGLKDKVMANQLIDEMELTRLYNIHKVKV